MSYECHITIPVADAIFGERVAQILDWKTSEIARDPLLGDKSFFYLTKHSTRLDSMVAYMEGAVYALETIGTPILRAKIEEIIYDTKTGVNKLPPKTEPPPLTSPGPIC